MRKMWTADLGKMKIGVNHGEIKKLLKEIEKWNKGIGKKNIKITDEDGTLIGNIQIKKKEVIVKIRSYVGIYDLNGTLIMEGKSND
jgi:hypothetical protein